MTRNGVDEAGLLARARLLGALVVVVAATTAAGASTAATPVVTATPPTGQTVQQLLRDRYVEVVTCRRACTITSTLRISPTVARRLGFVGVQPNRWHLIGRNDARLSAGKPTRLTFTLTAEAKQRLARLRARVQLVAEVIATTSAPRVRAQANWTALALWRAR